MIENNNLVLDSIKELTKNADSLREAITSFATEEDKQTEEYKNMVKELDSIEGELANIVTPEEAKSINQLSEIQSQFKFLNDIISGEDATPELIERAKRQIYLIESSYTLDALIKENKSTMSNKKLEANFAKLRSKVELKLKENPTFKFHSAFNLNKSIYLALDDILKQYSHLTTAYIYSFILSASLKPDGYAMLVFFLVKNLTNIKEDFLEKPILIDKLNALTAYLVTK